MGIDTYYHLYGTGKNIVFEVVKKEDLIKRGRWITPEGHENARVCSQCKMICHADNAMFYAYCPNCGAKMDGGEE